MTTRLAVALAGRWAGSGLCGGWRLREGFDGADAPRCSRRGGGEATGEQPEQRGLRASGRQPHANARDALDNARGDGCSGRSYWRARAQSSLQARPRVWRRLRNLRQESRCPYVNLRKVWLRVRKRAGIEDVRIHDPRHSIASCAVALGMSLPMIGKLLGHTQVQTTARYAHLAADPVKAAAEQVSRSMAALMGEAPTEVIAIRQQTG